MRVILGKLRTYSAYVNAFRLRVSSVFAMQAVIMSAVMQTDDKTKHLIADFLFPIPKYGGVLCLRRYLHARKALVPCLEIQRDAFASSRQNQD